MRNAKCKDAGMELDTPGKRLRWARKERGKFETAAAAAHAYGWNVSTYSGHENGDRIPSRGKAMRYATAFKVKWEWILEGPPGLPDDNVTIVAIHTKGEVAAGRWLDLDGEVDANDFEQHPVAPDQRYPIESQYGLIVRGTSINRVAQAGDVLHCIDLGLTGIEPVDGKLVIVERRRAQLGQKEVTAKRISRSGNVIFLTPDSTDGRWKPIELDTANPPEDEEIAVVAIVIGVYHPV